MTRRNRIEFYLAHGPFGKLSNFSKTPILLDGYEWPTVEHYFQSQKFVGTEYEQQIRMASSPSAAAMMGRDRSYPIRPDWEQSKDLIMRKAVMAKFTQHDELATMLLSTGDAEIVEHTNRDHYWGDGGDGSGLNKLGSILMDVRAELQAKGSVAGLMRERPVSHYTIKYTRYDPRRRPVKVKNSLIGFIYDVPYLAYCGILPPFHLMNRVLATGGSEGGMSPGATWKPFQLSPDEYIALLDALNKSTTKSLRGSSRFAQVDFKTDPKFDHIEDLSDWIQAVCAAHKQEWMLRLADASD